MGQCHNPLICKAYGPSIENTHFLFDYKRSHRITRIRYAVFALRCVICTSTASLFTFCVATLCNWPLAWQVSRSSSLLSPQSLSPSHRKYSLIHRPLPPGHGIVQLGQFESATIQRTIAIKCKSKAITRWTQMGTIATAISCEFCRIVSLSINSLVKAATHTGKLVGN